MKYQATVVITKTVTTTSTRTYLVPCAGKNDEVAGEKLEEKLGEMEFDAIFDIEKPVDPKGWEFTESDDDSDTEWDYSVGTIAISRGTDEDNLPGIKPNGGRPAEAWFRGIQPGDTPENNSISKITVEWIDEFATIVEGIITAYGGKICTSVVVPAACEVSE